MEFCILQTQHLDFLVSLLPTTSIPFHNPQGEPAWHSRLDRCDGRAGADPVAHVPQRMWPVRQDPRRRDGEADIGQGMGTRCLGDTVSGAERLDPDFDRRKVWHP